MRHFNETSGLPVDLSNYTTFWTTGKSMPTPRSEIGAGFELDGKIYVIGGQNVHLKKLDTVEVYNPLLNKWDAVAPLPVALDHAGVASDNVQLLVVGGSTEKHHTTNKLFIYDSNKDVWNEGKSMPTSRTMLTTDFVDGILYAVGGVNSTYNVVATNEAYDPKTDTWVEKKKCRPQGNMRRLRLLRGGFI